MNSTQSTVARPLLPILALVVTKVSLVVLVVGPFLYALAGETGFVQGIFFGMYTGLMTSIALSSRRQGSPGRRILERLHLGPLFPRSFEKAPLDLQTRLSVGLLGGVGGAIVGAVVTFPTEGGTFSKAIQLLVQLSPIMIGVSTTVWVAFSLWLGAAHRDQMVRLVYTPIQLSFLLIVVGVIVAPIGTKILSWPVYVAGTLSYLAFLAITSLSMMVGYLPGTLLGFWMKPRLHLFVVLLGYLSKMWVPLSTFALGYLGLSLLFASFYGAAWRADPTLFRGFSLDASFKDFFYFALQTLQPGPADNVVPTGDLTRLLTLLEPICGVIWTAVGLGLVVAHLQDLRFGQFISEAPYSTDQEDAKQV